MRMVRLRREARQKATEHLGSRDDGAVLGAVLTIQPLGRVWSELRSG